MSKRVTTATAADMESALQSTISETVPISVTPRDDTISYVSILPADLPRHITEQRRRPGGSAIDITDSQVTITTLTDQGTVLAVEIISSTPEKSAEIALCWEALGNVGTRLHNFDSENDGPIRSIESELGDCRRWMDGLWGRVGAENEDQDPQVDRSPLDGRDEDEVGEEHDDFS